MLRYARSVAAVVIGLALALWAQGVLDPTTVFLAAVIVAAWFGGRGPGLLAAVLALLAIEYFFTPPFYSLEPRLQQVPRLLVFAALAVLSAWGSAARKRAEVSLREAHDELDARVLARTAELTSANERLAMQYAITRVLAEASTLDGATSQLLRIIGEAAGWEWGALWIIDREAGTLRCGPIWHMPEVAAAPFSAACRETVFAPGLGLPGMVWQRRAPLSLADITADSSFVRIQSAAAAHLRGAIGFPVLFSDEILGVVEFFSRQVREPDAEQLDFLAAVGSQIGQFMKRMQDQDDLRRHASLLDLTHDTVFVRDMNDVITFWNRGAEEQYGWTGAEAQGHTTHELLRTVFPAPLAQINAELARTGRWEGELVQTRRNGTQIVVASRWARLLDGRANPIAILETNNDITERKRSEQALEELAGRLIHAQEEERSRIGRELHDHISQTLGVLTIRIDQLRADRALPAAVASALEGLRHDTVEITDDVHRLSHRLHSSTLDYLGLAPALQKLVNEFAERHDIAIDFAHASLPASLPSEVALCLFRVTEEALANIAKHSNARSARVRVTGAPDGIHLSVEDTGTGFDMTRLEKRAGLGFVSMQERLRVLRGSIRVDSAPSRGTRIEAWIPASQLPTSDLELPAPKEIA